MSTVPQQSWKTVAKHYLKQHRTDLVLIVLALLAALVVHGLSWAPGMQATKAFADSFGEMIAFIPAIFILVGLVDAWVPKETVARHTGAQAGWKSSFWMLLLAMLQAGPLYGAFPVAYLMWKKGTSPRNIFLYLGAFATLKLPMLGFEISFLGLDFTLARTVVTLPFIFLVAWLLDRWYGKNLVLHDGGSKGASR